MCPLHTRWRLINVFCSAWMSAKFSIHVGAQLGVSFNGQFIKGKKFHCLSRGEWTKPNKIAPVLFHLFFFFFTSNQTQLIFNITYMKQVLPVLDVHAQFIFLMPHKYKIVFCFFFLNLVPAGCKLQTYNYFFNLAVRSCLWDNGLLYLNSLNGLKEYSTYRLYRFPTYRLYILDGLVDFQRIKVTNLLF